ncbi:MAG: hypothetical protein WAV92_08095 [Halopseudomonas yangmingensis]
MNREENSKANVPILGGVTVSSQQCQQLCPALLRSQLPDFKISTPKCQQIGYYPLKIGLKQPTLCCQQRLVPNCDHGTILPHNKGR